MGTVHIDICGITPQYNLPRCSCNYPCKEICETHKLFIPTGKPDIENILQIFIDTSIKKYKILDTPMGKKLVIYGDINIKNLYVSNTSCQSVHSAHFDIPFCTFIMLGNISKEVTDICLYIEDAFITQLDSKSFFISMIILAYPLLSNNTNSFCYRDDCNENCYINFNKASNNSNKINYHKDNSSDDFRYDMAHSNTSDIEFDIQYDMTQSKPSDIEHEINYDMNSNNSINSNPIHEDEYFENEWK